LERAPAEKHGTDCHIAIPRFAFIIILGMSGKSRQIINKWPGNMVVCTLFFCYELALLVNSQTANSVHGIMGIVEMTCSENPAKGSNGRFKQLVRYGV